MRFKGFSLAVGTLLWVFSGLAWAESSMTCTCGGQTYRGSCPTGQKAVSCDCKSITLICQKAAPAAKPAAKNAAAGKAADKGKGAQNAKADPAKKPAAKPAPKPPAKPAAKPAPKPPAKPAAGAPPKPVQPG